MSKLATKDIVAELDGPKLYDAPYYQIDDVTIAFPKKNKQWQRRVIEHMLPDSPVADSPEKIPYRLLYAQTSSQQTENGLETVFSGDLRHLRDVFYAQTRGSAVPVAFHVLMVKAKNAKVVTQRLFTERTFRLLCTDEKGRLDDGLITDLLNRFRASPDDLDLASRVVLKGLQPMWDPTQFEVEVDQRDARTVPFVPDASRLFRADIRTLLDGGFIPADFFELLTQTLTLHLGLYLPRLAARLNPTVAMMLDEFGTPGAADVERMRRIEAGDDDEYQFRGSISVRAASPGAHRRLSRASAPRLAYIRMERDLTYLHFSLLLFNQVRDLARQHISAAWEGGDPAALHEMSAAPSVIVERMQAIPEFRRFMSKATVALALRFVREQMPEDPTRSLVSKIEEMPSGLHALRDFYYAYNLLEPNTATKNRATKQGIHVADALLGRGDRGLVQDRRGVGRYFEIGVGIVPLLLLLSMGAHSEKIRISKLWARFEDYGLHLDDTERDLLLNRLKSMGLYERYSDAGEANYVRNLLVTPERDRHATA